MSAADLRLPDPQTVAVAAVTTTLIPWATAKREEIRQRQSIPDALEVTRRLEAFRHYLQDREGRDLLAVEARRTEVLIGQLLGPAVLGSNQHTEPLLVSKGSEVPPQDRFKFRLLAAHDERVEGWLTQTPPVVSREALLAKIRRLTENDAMPEVEAGDFRDVLAGVPDGSASLILTDPPYGENAVFLYSDLGQFARRVLRPGGSLLCYTGQSILPDVLDTLSHRLRYWWTLALVHRHGGQQLPGKWVIAEWKPVVWFVNDHRLGREYVPDVLRGSAPEKAHHDWAQGIEEVVPLIERLTEPGELVVDPFAGSGAFGRAALGLGRRFVGADLEPASMQGRIA